MKALLSNRVELCCFHKFAQSFKIVPRVRIKQNRENFVLFVGFEQVLRDIHKGFRLIEKGPLPVFHHWTFSMFFYNVTEKKFWPLRKDSPLLERKNLFLIINRSLTRKWEVGFREFAVAKQKTEKPWVLLFFLREELLVFFGKKLGFWLLLGRLGDRCRFSKELGPFVVEKLYCFLI